MKSNGWCTSAIAISLAIVWVWLAPAIAAEPPSAEFVAAALMQQEVAAGPSLEVRYTYGNQADREGTPGTGRASMRYVRTPAVRFLERRDEVYQGGSTPELIGTTRISYDRATPEIRVLTVDNHRSSGLISVADSPSWLRNLENVETTYYWMGFTTLASGIGHGTVFQQMEDVEGSSCWKVAVPGEAIGMKAENTIYVWVDPSIGFCPRRMDSTHQGPDAAKTARICFLDYERVREGLWFPRRVTIQIDCDKPDDGRALITVESVSAGRVVPDSETRIDFPSGTEVTLSDSASYIVP